MQGCSTRRGYGGFNVPTNFQLEFAEELQRILLLSQIWFERYYNCGKIFHGTTYFIPLISFHTIWKYEKTICFLMFSGDIAKEQWHKMGLLLERNSFHRQQNSLHEKWSFPLRISSVNVTKSAGFCGFSHIYDEILNGKLHFLCSDL